MQKRNFIKRGLSGLALVMLSTLPFSFSRLLQHTETTLLKIKQAISHRRLRPPGALADDEEFISACISCGLCSEVCPPNCIQFYRNDGSDNANTPFILPAEKGCTLCGKCMDVCPTDALTKVDRNKVEMGVARIDRDACYPWVDHGVCGACVTICPLGNDAISFDFANIYRPIVQEGCVGCGLCVEVCPHPSLPIRIV